MNTQDIIKDIKETVWWREETPAAHNLMNYIFRTFVSCEKITGYPNLTRMMFIIKDGNGLELTPKLEKEKNFEWLIEKVKKEPDYLDNFYKDWKLLMDKILLTNKEILSLKSPSNKDLLRLYNQLEKQCFEAVIYGAFIECVDPYSEKLPSILNKKYKLDNEAAIILTAPAQRSFMTQEKIDFNNLCLGNMTFEQYHQKWFWIDTNYNDPEILTIDMVKDKVANDKRTQEQLSKDIKETEEYEKKLLKDKKELIEHIDKDDRLIISIVERLGYFIDIRKESMMQHTYSRDILLRVIAEQCGYDIKIVRGMILDEIENKLNDKPIDENLVKERSKCSVTYYTPGNKEKIIYREDAEEIYNAYVKKITKSEIKGTVASAPVKKISGIVNIVTDTRKQELIEGNILVTTMTRPDFLPLMRKAKAIITDEGGLTCHAAIVSRELGIPCIIGTKNATRSLKTGDSVEMNLETGAITKNE